MKKRNIFVTVLLAVCMCISLTSCGSSSDYMNTDTESNYYTNGSSDLYYEDYYDGSDMYESESITEESGSVSSNRKLIKTVDLTAETYEFDELVVTIEKKVDSLGGYMESTSIHTNWNDLKYGDFTIRVPVDKLDDFITAFAEVSNITDKSASQKDVTLDYVDLESHKAALEAEETSLLTLLENAMSIEDIIAIQSRLTDVRYQLESMESQLRTMDNLIDYATIYLNVEEVETYTPVEEPSMGERISTGFKQSLKQVGTGFKNLVIFVVVNSPYLVIWAVIITVTILVLRLIIKKAIKKGDENEAKRQQMMQERMQQVNAQNGQNNGK